jgi:hypothetical protein
MEMSKLGVESRRTNMEWMLSLISRNPPQTPTFWMYKFSELTGLKPETVKDYLKTLQNTKRIVLKGGRLYVTGTM